MSARVRTSVTLLALCALVVLAAVWGWSAATEPLPGKVDRPICVDTPVAAGAKVYPAQVAVSVYNASHREGLAGRTMQSLKDAGFVAGEAGNVQRARVPEVAIWTEDPHSPAVQLVASHLGPGARVEKHAGLGVGVTVIVGDRFTGVVKGRPAVAAEKDTQICSPPVS
jgi:hypothetical protein